MVTPFFCPNEQWGALTRALLADHKSLRLRLRGWSMYPAIHNDDIAHIHPVAPEEIEPGAVVLYTVNQRPIVHRVVRQRYDDAKPYFLICSDFTGQGHWVAAERIFGKVTAIERDGRTFSLQGWRGRLWGWAFSRLWRRASVAKKTFLAHCRQ